MDSSGNDVRESREDREIGQNPKINSVGQRPTNTPPQNQALKGRNQKTTTISPFQGFDDFFSNRGALPHAIDARLSAFCRDFGKCTLCGECIRKCPAQALTVCGETVAVDELYERISRDKEFYANGGGVTFSGGEPLLQADFVAQCLKMCKENNIHTAIDTSGHVPFSEIEKTLPHCDLYLYDIKTINSQKHKEFTGVENKIILDNLKELDTRDVEIWIRVPVVNGFNATHTDMAEIAGFVSSLKHATKVTPMPYHHLGSHLYPALGLEYPLHFDAEINEESMSRFSKIFIRTGVNVPAFPKNLDIRKTTS